MAHTTLFPAPAAKEAVRQQDRAMRMQRQKSVLAEEAMRLLRQPTKQSARQQEN